MTLSNFACSFLAVGLALTPIAQAMEAQKDKKAIVLAEFGTSYPSALRSLLTIQQEVKNAFPGTEVRIAFTSNILRNIWHARQNDKEFLAQYKDIPKEILYVKTPLATIADLQDEGYNIFIVQPTHIYAGEEYTDLISFVDGLNSIKTIKAKFMPWKKLVMGRPILGKAGDQYPYKKDLEIAAKALASDIDIANKNKAALVYMGHGNDHFSTGVYMEFEDVLRKMYPNTSVYIGTVEGFPLVQIVSARLVKDGTKKIVLKPLMIVAGDHANNDMAGDEDDSWKSIIKSKGIEVVPVIKGLGENPEIGKILIQHIKDVAKENQIEE